MINYRLNISIALGILFFCALPSHAADLSTNAPAYVSINNTECQIEMSIPQALSEHVQLRPVAIPPEYTSPLSLVSPFVCEFDVDDDTLYDHTMPLRIVMKYANDKGYRPRIYYWDNSRTKWIPLPSIMNRSAKIVEADMHFAYARVAVFIEETGMHEGIASWYSDKRFPDGAATDRYPVGTRLKVTNIKNGKTVIVKTTSTWNNSDKKRVIDLVKTAFAKIASPTEGLVSVRIEKLF